MQTTDSSGNPVDLGPSIFNTFLLDTGSTSILSAADATGDLEGSGLYQVYPIQYLEQGVGGYTAMDVSYPYQFYFAGTNGVPYEISNTQILSSEDLQFSFLGPDGIVGMPAMTDRFTNIDMTGWEDPQDVSDLSIKTDFPTGTDIPTDSGHWYQVPVNLVDFPNDGQLPGGPIPTSAPLAMIPVTIRDNGHEVTSNFLLDTGAQLSMVSPDVAQALNLDLNHPSGSIDVGGVGGTVTVPLVPVDQLDVKATNGTSLAWSNLQVGVLDLSVPGGPTIGGVFGMDFLTSGWAAKILPILLGEPGSSENGYFDNVYLDYRNSSSGTGTIIFDVDPSHDTPAPPDPNSLSVSYSSIAAVNAVGGDGSDTFNVTPSQTIAYTIDGGSQPTGGADVLQLVPGNPQAVTNGSTITIPGDNGIDYLNIEQLDLAIPDSGFEQVQVGTGQFRYRPSGSPWTFAGSSGLSANNSGFTAGNPPAPEGTQVAFLQRTGSFSQSVTSSAAGSYVITFDAAQRANYQASHQDFEVLVDGVVISTFTPSSTSYLSYSTAAFTVTAGSHTIKFLGLDSAGGDNTAFVDAVTLASPSSIGDPGFEQVQVGAGHFQYRPTGSPWTFSGNSGISANNSAFTSGNPPAPQGTQVAFLQRTGSFTQTVTGWAAGSYVITFDAAQRATTRRRSRTSRYWSTAS